MNPFGLILRDWENDSRFLSVLRLPGERLEQGEPLQGFRFTFDTPDRSGFSSALALAMGIRAEPGCV
jgi:hypothetical protein